VDERLDVFNDYIAGVRVLRETVGRRLKEKRSTLSLIKYSVSYAGLRLFFPDKAKAFDEAVRRGFDCLVGLHQALFDYEIHLQQLYHHLSLLVKREGSVDKAMDVLFHKKDVLVNKVWADVRLVDKDRKRVSAWAKRLERVERVVKLEEFEGMASALSLLLPNMALVRGTGIKGLIMEVEAASALSLFTSALFTGAKTQDVVAHVQSDPLFYAGLGLLITRGRVNERVMKYVLKRPMRVLDEKAFGAVLAFKLRKVKGALACARNALHYTPTSRLSTLLLKNLASSPAFKQSKAVFALFDKSQMWVLNSLHPRLGDLGLKAYFNAFARVSKKFPEVKVVRTTEHGDEVFVAFFGDQQRFQSFVNALKEAMAAEVAHAPQAVRSVLSSFSYKWAEVELKPGAVVWRGKEYRDMTRFVIDLESSVHTLPQHVRERLKPLLSVSSSQSLSGGARGRVWLALRFKVDDSMAEALSWVTEREGKAVSHVRLNVIGPSVTNLLSHEITDVIDERVSAVLRSYGFERHGPFIYTTERAFSERELKSLNKAVNDVVKDMGLQISYGVVTRSKEAVGRALLYKVAGIKMTDVEWKRVNRAIALLHLKDVGVKEVAVKGLSLANKENVLSALTLPKHVRNALDFYEHLKRRGVSDEVIKAVFKRLSSSQVINESVKRWRWEYGGVLGVEKGVALKRAG